VPLVAGLIWGVALGAPAAQTPGPPLPAAASASSDTLSAPPVLQNLSTLPGVVEVTMTAAPTRLALRPGAPTAVYAYNGRIPGPTLEVHEGDRVIVHFTNELPEPTTIHWHGIHLPAAADGSPFYPVPPGGHYDYAFTIAVGAAGTYWYHPHPDGRAGYQVAHGLFGAFIVRAAVDPLPPTLPEKLLILSDNRFRSDGTVDLPDPDSPRGRVDAENGREGEVLFVNGQILPTLVIRSGEVQRWRIINASAARVFRLTLPGQTMLHVGDDGGLFERPREVDQILLANSERVELLVRGGPAGRRTTLETLPYDRYVPQTRPADWNRTREVLTLVTSGEPPLPPVAVPAVLRVIPALDTAQAIATRLIVLTNGMLNSKMMDMTRVDFRGQVGTTEIWAIENLVGMDHPFHLHGFQFQVLDRNGVPAPYRSWKDTINVPKHETARVIVRFDDYAGKWMFHCHILDHEDRGMMGVLQLE
jgi:FtsP/CotA-like multicopper oxidase with cupredoxin domain